MVLVKLEGVVFDALCLWPSLMGLLGLGIFTWVEIADGRCDCGMTEVEWKVEVLVSWLNYVSVIAIRTAIALTSSAHASWSSGIALRASFLMSIWS